jgi:hypothetical protein
MLLRLDLKIRILQILVSGSGISWLPLYLPIPDTVPH